MSVGTYGTLKAVCYVVLYMDNLLIFSQASRKCAGPLMRLWFLCC